MRRFLSISFLALALMVGAASGAPSAHAATPQDTAMAAYLACQAACPSEGDATCSNICQANFEQAGGSFVADPALTKAAANTPTNINSGSSDTVFNTVMFKIAGLFAWLVGVASLTLDYSVYYTVVNMGAYIGKLTAIGVTWRILRDIGNIMLIFGFLAIGISVILNTERIGYGKKMLPMLLVAAVFLNFSLFFAEAVIDTGNLFATQFYKQINGGDLPKTNASGAILGSDGTAASLLSGKEGVSSKLMSQLGLASIYDVRNNSYALNGDTPWFTGFLAILLFIVTAFVMFSLAFILIARFIVLVFLIILAPVGFAGLAVPQLAGKAKQWWDTLFQQTITAPVLLLLLYVALAVITDAQFLTGLGGGTAGAVTGFIDNNNLAGFASYMMSFSIAIGLMLAVTISAKSLSAYGAGHATKLAGKVTGALTFGAISVAGRGTLGLAGNVLASKRMQSWARNSNTNVLGRYAARSTAAIGKGLRSSAFDLRNVPGTSAGLGMLGIDTGKGATFTAKQAHEAQYGAKPVKEFFKKGTEEREAAGREIDFKDAQNAIEGAKTKLAAGFITPAQHDLIVSDSEKVITGTLSKMSTKQLEELGGIKKGTEALVKNLSPQQFEALMKSDKLSEGEKGKIKEARYNPVSNAISSGIVPDIKKSIGALSKGELEAMPAAMLANPLVLAALSDKQRETITDSKERTAAEKDLVRNSSATGTIESTFKSAATPAAGAAAVAPLIGGLTVAQVGKLDKDLLVQPLVAERLTTAMLIELQEQKKLKGSDMTVIGNAIRASATASVATKNFVTTGPGAALWS